MDDLIVFVGARLDEAWRRAGAMGHFTVGEPCFDCPATRTAPLGDLPWGEDACTCGLAGRRARAFREVEAGRALIAEYRRALEKAPGNRPLLNVLVRLVRGRAGVWCDHPDYRAEWKL